MMEPCGDDRQPDEHFEDQVGQDNEDEEEGRISRAGLNDVVEPIMDASFQDDFDDIHSEYQWFTESGFSHDAATTLGMGNFSTPLCIGVGTDLEFDATMAHIDMEDFQSQDILLRLPPLCASDLQPHQGETIASITGSILEQFDFEASMSPNSHSLDDEQNQSMEMSICKSENLFSPMAENQQQLPLSTFSTDSLDARGETILATCMTNRNNYTIAFQGIELDESTNVSTYRTATENNLISPASDMTENEMTNWRQLKTDNGHNPKYGARGSGGAGGDNNNGSSNGSSGTSSNFSHQQQHHGFDARTLLTQSCPNPWYWKKNSMVFNNNNNHPRVQTAAFVKLFDIHMSRPMTMTGGARDNSSMTESNMLSAGSTNNTGSSSRYFDNNNTSAGSAGTGSNSSRYGYTMEESWNNNRNPNPNPFRIRTKFEKARPTTTTQMAEAIKKSRSIQIQTSSYKLIPKRMSSEQYHENLQQHHHHFNSPATPSSCCGTPKKSAPVFVCFPSYTLPDLQFLKKGGLVSGDNGEAPSQQPEVYLLPQKFKIPARSRGSVSGAGGGGGRESVTGCGNSRGTRSSSGVGGSGGRRPMSCNDVEDLKKRGLSHVRDWPSLNFLLPREYQSILEEMKPLEKREQNDETEKERDATMVVPTTVTAVAAAGAVMAGENNNEAEEEERVILRRKPGRNHERGSTKRYSLNDVGGSPGRNRAGSFAEHFKRFSLQETLPEVAEITTEIAKNLEQLESLASHLGTEFAQEFNNDNVLPTGGGGVVDSGSSSPGNYTGRRVPNNTPKQGSYVDYDNHFKTLAEGAAKIVAQVAPMCNNLGDSRSSSSSSSKHGRLPIDMAEKQSLTDAIAAAVTQIQQSWTPITAQNIDQHRVTSHKSSGGRSQATYPNLVIMSETPAGKMVLESLCPALYSLLSDGLCPFLETIFGRVPNTVWRVVEASIQYGPTAQSLNELVLRINSEELLAEGPMKLNAFVFGLLNLGNLGSWLTFLRTKERLLRTHYEPEAFLFLCNTSTRFLYDQMLVNMHLLSRLPYQLDIFHEAKLLHQSMNPSSFLSTKSNPAALPVMRKAPAKVSSRTSTTTHTRKSTSADARIPKYQSKNSKYYANQLKKSQMKRSFSDERPKASKLPASIPKSKTAQNIQNERHLASAVPKPLSYGLARFPSKPKISAYSSAEAAAATTAAASADREKGMEPTKAQRPKTIETGGDNNGGGGGGGESNRKDPDRFRRLQMQWELLSNDEARKTTSPVAGAPNSNPALAGSKIPRPITSPIRNYHPALPGCGPNVRPTSKR